jgi:spore coat polysaccharide biosynthesis protein SpsF
MLGRLLDRLGHVRGIDGVCVATSDAPSDDSIAAFCAANATRCYRGQLDNVAARLLKVATELKADAFVRVNGDSPLLDPELVTQAIDLFRSKMPDLVSNVVVRTFPKGQSVEVIDTARMRAALPYFNGSDEYEHVTAHFYRNAVRFRIVSFERAENVSSLQLSVDTEDDLARVRNIYARFERPPWSYGVDEIIGMLKERAA